MDEQDAHSADARDFESRSRQPTPSAREAVAAIDRWLLEKVMKGSGEPPVSVVLWDGKTAWCSAQPPVAAVHIHDRAALVGLMLNPERQFGDYYESGRVEVEGSLLQFLERLYSSKALAAPPGSWRHDLNGWINRPRSNTLVAARDNIHSHYDLGNDFYRLWLDERMVYTCAYYESEDCTLEQAQVAKMDHVCRKLQLEPGQSVVEAGCGWGALALHMAKNFGVQVRAYNISSQQVAYARERAAREGLTGSVEFIEDDYRNIKGSYDAFVSVGMLEHVGVSNYRTLGGVAKKVLRAGGRGLIHSIGRNYPQINNPWIEHRIFPGSRPPSLSEMSEIFEPNALTVLDIENLRLHYARTCTEWLARYESALDKVRAMYDEPFVRAWRLYLSGSVAAFRVGTLQLFQVVFSHTDDHTVPLTRRHLYPAQGD